MHFLCFPVPAYFNPRSHKGSDTPYCKIIIISVYFNPRSHKGSDTTCTVFARYSNFNFNPRSHKGSDEPSIMTFMRKIIFQSTLPQGERPIHAASWLLRMHFNPRSHKGSDKTCGCYMYRATDISIHAPTRGATDESLTVAFGSHISIHAPTRGATRYSVQ